MLCTVLRPQLQNPSCTHNGKPYGHHDPSRPPLKLPHPPAGEPDEGGDDSDPTRQAGIHAIEMYVPRHAVKAAVLEKAHGVDGKYTQGLMMTEFCGTGDDEDPVSIALSAVSRLMYRYNVKYEGTNAPPSLPPLVRTHPPPHRPWYERTRASRAWLLLLLSNARAPAEPGCCCRSRLLHLSLHPNPQRWA